MFVGDVVPHGAFAFLVFELLLLLMDFHSLPINNLENILHCVVDQ